MRCVGRPAIDTAFKIRTKAWFNAVSQASGMNAEELEIYFAPPDKQAIYKAGNRPRLWEKYRDGRHCPKSENDRNGSPSIVQRVEKRFPGTAKWIAIPFWQVLSYTPMEMHELKAIYLSLSKPVRKLIVMEKPHEERMFWRRPTDYEILYDQLLSIGDLDATTAVLALIKEAEVTQNQLQHQFGLRCWAYCDLILQKHPVLSLVLSDINAIIEDRFVRISYAAADGQYFKMTKNSVRSCLYWRGKS